MEDRAWRLSLFDNKLEKIEEIDPLTGDLVRDLSLVKVYANSHYITPKPTIEQAIINIRKELEITIKKHKVLSGKYSKRVGGGSPGFLPDKKSRVVFNSSTRTCCFNHF